MKPTTGEWKKFGDPRPYVSLAIFAVDWQGRFPILHRGPNVRSAANCWSVPTGLHEVGLTAQQQIATELQEEVGIDCMHDFARQVGVYENIAVDDGWHWFISVWVVPTTADLDKLKNLEPEKHTEVRPCGDLSELLALPLAPSMNDAFSKWSALGAVTDLASPIQWAHNVAFRAKQASGNPDDA